MFVQLHWIDMLIILVYMIGCFVIGLYTTKYIDNAGDFFLAGKSLPFWAVGFSIVVSDIGATDFIGVAGNTYVNGVSAANFDWLGSMPAMVFAAFVFVPYFWRSGVFTIPEFLGRRYNVAVQLLNASIWITVMLISLIMMLWTTADDLVRTMLGFDPYYTVWIMAVVTGIYTFSGGLSAVVMTDAVQLVVMYVSGLSLLALSLWEVGGWSSMRAAIESMGGQFSTHFTILLPNTHSEFPWSGIVFGLGVVLAIAYMSGNQAIVHRTLGARTEWDAKAGMLLGGFLKSFIPVMVALPGLCALVYLPHAIQNDPNAVPAEMYQMVDTESGPVPVLNERDRVVPTMMRLMLPPGLQGLMLAGLLAALMSSISGTLSSASTIFVTDIYNRGRQLLGFKALNEKSALHWGRGFTAFLIIASSLLAPQFDRVDGLYNFIQTVLSLFQGPTLAILLLGILWPRANRWGALTGLLLGVLFCFAMWCVPNLFPAEDPFLYIAMYSFLFALVVTVVVSLLTPPEPEEKIRGLVWSSVVQDPAAQAALNARIEA